MFSILRFALTAAIAVAGGVVFADDYVFDSALSGSESIDWSDPSSYTGSHTSGPAAGDTVYIPAGMTVKVTAGTDNWSLINGLARIVPNAKAVLVVEVPGSYEGVVELEVPISEYGLSGAKNTGRLIKTGEGTLELACYGKVIKDSDAFYDYYVNINVEKGCLKLCAKGTGSTERFYYGNLYVEDGATLELCKVGYTRTPALNGSGFVHLDNDEEQRLYIHGGGDSCYSGWMTGAVRIDITDGRHDITCPTNTINTICTSGDAVCGYTKMGMSGEVSSLGTGNFNVSGSSGIVYLGTEDETSDKALWLGGNAFVDGGEYGGLTFSGKLAYSGVSKMRILTLCGPNADNPCTITGTFPISTKEEDKTVMYIMKKGAGTWRFGGSSVNRSSLGVIDVMEGTLQFDSIAEKGELCSLGYATNLFEATSTLTYETASPVDYAFVLGGDATVGTMEYLGSEVARCSTRPMAIRSKGRFISDVSPYLLENVYALGAGEKTFILTGNSDHGNAVSGVSDGSDGGTLSLRKEGIGSWNLLNPSSFTGSLVVRDGVMRVDNVKDRKYRWYRICFTENGYGCDRYDTTYSKGENSDGTPKTLTSTEKCTIQLLETALYDSEGNNLLSGFSSGEPEAIDQYDFNGYYAAQKPGTVVLATKGGYWFNAANGQMYNLFDNKNTKMVGYSTSSSNGMTIDNPASWMVFVVRLPDDAADAVKIDFMSALSTNSTVASYNGRVLTAFRLDGSADGVNWDVGIAQNDALEAPADGAKWYSDPTGSTIYGNRPGKGFDIAKTASDASCSHGFTCVGASNGGVLDIVGSPYTVSGLVIDASASAGSISNVVFAAEGTVYVENMADMGAGSASLPGDYSHLDGLDNLSKWNLSIDGESSSSHMVVVENGRLCLKRRGLRIILR